MTMLAITKPPEYIYPSIYLSIRGFSPLWYVHRVENYAPTPCQGPLIVMIYH